MTIQVDNITFFTTPNYPKDDPTILYLSNAELNLLTVIKEIFEKKHGSYFASYFVDASEDLQKRFIKHLESGVQFKVPEEEKSVTTIVDSLWKNVQQFVPFTSEDLKNIVQVKGGRVFSKQQIAFLFENQEKALRATKEANKKYLATLGIYVKS